MTFQRKEQSSEALITRKATKMCMDTLTGCHISASKKCLLVHSGDFPLLEVFAISYWRNVKTVEMSQLVLAEVSRKRREPLVC